MNRSRRGSIANAALIALLFLCGVLVALAFERKQSATYGAMGGEGIAPRDAVDALQLPNVKNVEGQLVPLLTAGEPAIIMISSETCSWCKQALADLGKLSAGRPLPRLKLLTLEGAAIGQPMVDREGLSGVQLIGPPDGGTQVSLTFRFQGTPTFIAIDRKGKLVRMLPGYPMPDVMKVWYNVMVGDSDVP